MQLGLYKPVASDKDLSTPRKCQCFLLIASQIRISPDELGITSLCRTPFHLMVQDFSSFLDLFSRLNSTRLGRTDPIIESHCFSCQPHDSNIYFHLEEIQRYQEQLILLQTISKTFKVPAELAATTMFVLRPQQTLETKCLSSLPLSTSEARSSGPNL